MLLPKITPLDKPFWDAAKDNRLVVQARPAWWR